MTNLTIDGLIDSFTVYLEVNKNYAKGTVEIYNRTAVRLSSQLKDTRNVIYIEDVTGNDLQLFLGTLRHSNTKDNDYQKSTKAGAIFEATTRANDYE